MTSLEESPADEAGALIEELQSVETHQPVAFTWPTIMDGCRRIGYITLGQNADENYALVLYQAPLPPGFPGELIDKLNTYTDEQGRVFMYVELGHPPARNGKINHLEKAANYLAGLPEYTLDLTGRLSQKQQLETSSNVEELKVEDLVEFMKEKTCLIYTGAGISVDAGLPTSPELKKLLGVNMSAIVDRFTSSMCDPDARYVLENHLRELQQKFYGPPTKTHWLLAETKELAGGKITITTDNLDKLHQKAGTPVITLANIEKIPEEYLRIPDLIIITLGLSQQYTNLIPRYRKLNPNGRVIAVNIAKPPYSYPVDGYVLCPAQDFCEFLKESLSREG